MQSVKDLSIGKPMRVSMQRPAEASQAPEQQDPACPPEPPVMATAGWLRGWRAGGAAPAPAPSALTTTLPTWLAWIIWRKAAATLPMLWLMWRSGRSTPVDSWSATLCRVALMTAGGRKSTATSE